MALTDYTDPWFSTKPSSVLYHWPCNGIRCDVRGVDPDDLVGILQESEMAFFFLYPELYSCVWEILEKNMINTWPRFKHVLDCALYRDDLHGTFLEEYVREHRPLISKKEK